MPIHAYELARQCATIEIDEINAQIEKLTQRKGLISRLLGVFEELDPSSSHVENPVLDVQAPEVAGIELPEPEVAAAEAQS